MHRTRLSSALAAAGPRPPGARGFTLVEMITALVVISIVSAAMAVFLRAPLQAYFDVTGRGLVGDTANLALQRMNQDLGTALPNSVRVTQAGASWFLEVLEVSGSGRYRNAGPSPVGCPAPSGALDFGAADTCFMTLGTVSGAVVPNASFMVVDNQGPGCPNDAYFGGNATVAGGNKSLITGHAPFAGPPAYDRVQMQAVNLPAACQSPTRQFYVVSGPVSYECNPVTGQLIRHAGYPIVAAQPTVFAAGTAALLATGVTGCGFTYNASPLATRYGTVSVTLVFSRNDPTSNGIEAATVFTQIHVSKTL